MHSSYASENVSSSAAPRTVRNMSVSKSSFRKSFCTNACSATEPLPAVDGSRSTEMHIGLSTMPTTRSRVAATRVTSSSYRVSSSESVSTSPTAGASSVYRPAGACATHSSGRAGMRPSFRFRRFSSVCPFSSSMANTRVVSSVSRSFTSTMSITRAPCAVSTPSSARSASRSASVSPCVAFTSISYQRYSSM